MSSTSVDTTLGGMRVTCESSRVNLFLVFEAESCRHRPRTCTTYRVPWAAVAVHPCPTSPSLRPLTVLRLIGQYIGMFRACSMKLIRDHSTLQIRGWAQAQN